MDVYRNLIGTLLAHSSSTPPIIMASSQANAEIGIGYCPTITAAAGMAGNNQPILFDNHGPDTRYSGPVKVAQTITSALGREATIRRLLFMENPTASLEMSSTVRIKTGETAAAISRESVIR